MCNMYLKFTYFRVFTSIEKPIWPIQSLAQNILKKNEFSVDLGVLFYLINPENEVIYLPYWFHQLDYEEKAVRAISPLWW